MTGLGLGLDTVLGFTFTGAVTVLGLIIALDLATGIVFIFLIGGSEKDTTNPTRNIEPTE